MLILSVFKTVLTNACVYTNRSYNTGTHYVSVIPIIQSKILCLIGNEEIGQYYFPSVLLQTHETGDMGAKRAAYDFAGCSGDVTLSPFYVEGNMSWYVMDVNREDMEWSATVRDRKHIELIVVGNDPTIDDHLKYIIGECNLQGYIVY
ncbi:hypothetical protein BDAP_001906 [Binucleata daphniae]